MSMINDSEDDSQMVCDPVESEDVPKEPSLTLQMASEDDPKEPSLWTTFYPVESEDESQEPSPRMACYTVDSEDVPKEPSLQMTSEDDPKEPSLWTTFYPVESEDESKEPSPQMVCYSEDDPKEQSLQMTCDLVGDESELKETSPRMAQDPVGSEDDSQMACDPVESEDVPKEPSLQLTCDLLESEDESKEPSLWTTFYPVESEDESTESSPRVACGPDGLSDDSWKRKQIKAFYINNVPTEESKICKTRPDGDNITSLSNPGSSVDHDSAVSIALEDFSYLISPSSSSSSPGSQNTSNDTEGARVPNTLADQISTSDPQIIKNSAASWFQKFASPLTNIEALRSFLELILHTTGLKIYYTVDKVLNLDNFNSATLDSWLSTPGINPLIPDEQYELDVSEFMVMALKMPVLRDAEFVSRIKLLLSIMTVSQWRSARYTAMIFGSQMLVLYAQLWQGTEELINEASPHYSRHIQSMKLTLLVVKKLFGNFFSLLGKYLRDIDLVIRKFAMEAATKCYITFKGVFFRDIYLRNIFWVFHDPSSHMRNKAVKLCGRLVCLEGYAEELKLFKQKVVLALIKRTYDENTQVAISALTALTGLYRKEPLTLHGYNMENLYRWVYCNHQPLRAAAGLFLYQVLSEQHHDNEGFIMEVIDFLFESEVTFSGLCHEVLVSALFPAAADQLTDWSVWSTLLLEGPLHNSRLECACRLLRSVLHRATCTSSEGEATKHFPPVPARVEEPQQLDREERLRERYKTEVTLHFAKYLIHLWEKYKRNNLCLVRLIGIPQYFGRDFENTNMKQICCYLLTLKYQNTELLDQSLCSLAVLRGLMASSSRWRKHVPLLDRCLMGTLSEEFLATCQRIGTRPKCFEVDDLIFLRKATYIPRYFDVTKTNLFSDAFLGLQYGEKNLNMKIVECAAPMCVRIIQWQLRNVLEGSHPANERKALLYKIISKTRTTAVLLEKLLSSRIRRIRLAVSAYKSLCKLHMLLCVKNKYTKDCELIHLPPLSTEVSEWMSFILFFEAPVNETPSVTLKFLLNTKVLEDFCSLLVIGSVSLGYISSILPYFVYYRSEKNYNNVLENAMRELIGNSNFAHVLIKHLGTLVTKADAAYVQIMIDGLCSVVFSKMKPAKQVRKLIVSILNHGVTHIQVTKDTSLFPVLGQFMKLLSLKGILSIKQQIWVAFRKISRDVNFLKFMDDYSLPLRRELQPY